MPGSLRLIHVSLGLVSQKANARPPWLHISERQEEFLSADYVPEHFTIREPSRLKVNEKILLLDFWRARQDNPKAKHAFLWTAHLVGDDMIPHNYVVCSDESGSGPATKKPRKKAKQRKGKGKLKATSAGGGSGNESDSGGRTKVQQQINEDANRIMYASDRASDSAVSRVPEGAAVSESLEDSDEAMAVDTPMASMHNSGRNRPMSKKKGPKLVAGGKAIDDSKGSDDEEANDEKPEAGVQERDPKRPVVKKVRKLTAIMVDKDIRESEGGDQDTTYYKLPGQLQQPRWPMPKKKPLAQSTADAIEETPQDRLVTKTGPSKSSALLNRCDPPDIDGPGEMQVQGNITPGSDRAGEESSEQEDETEDEDSDALPVIERPGGNERPTPEMWCTSPEPAEVRPAAEPLVHIAKGPKQKGTSKPPYLSKVTNS